MQEIFSTLNWSYTFNGLKKAINFVPRSCKGVLRIEPADVVAQSILGVIQSLQLNPMTVEMQPFQATQFILDKGIFGNVLEDTGMLAHEIEAALQAAAAMAPAPPQALPQVYQAPVPSTPSVTNAQR